MTNISHCFHLTWLPTIQTGRVRMVQMSRPFELCPLPMQMGISHPYPMAYIGSVSPNISVTLYLGGYDSSRCITTPIKSVNHTFSLVDIGLLISSGGSALRQKQQHRIKREQSPPLNLADHNQHYRPPKPRPPLPPPSRRNLRSHSILPPNNPPLNLRPVPLG